MTLLTRLFVLVFLTLLPILGIEAYNEVDVRARRAEEGQEQALRLVRLVANEQSRMVEGARQLLTVLGKSPAIRSGDIAACSAFLADVARSYPQYLSLASIDLTGHPVCMDAPTAPAVVVADRTYFKLALEKRGLVIGEYDVDAVSGRKAMYLAQPYYDGEDRIAGVMAVGISLDWLNSEIARSPLPPKATVSVIDRQGTILARYPETERFVGTKIAGQSHTSLLWGGEGVREAPGFDGVVRIYSYTALPGGPSGLTISVGLDKSELFKGSAAANRRDIVVMAGSCVLALILAAIGARVFISRPIRALLDAAEQWRQGSLDVRVPFSRTRSEFGRLGVAFNAMAAALGAREQELERRVRQRTEALHESMKARQVAEAALHDTRRLESVGRLTGGVAHDFNNLLAAIVGNIELARTRLGPNHLALPQLDAGLQSARRGAALTQQLLAFARRQNLRPEVVDLNHYIRASQSRLQLLLRSDVRVEARLAAKAWLVRVDPHQLEAAILNLVVNARDAMPNGGCFLLETRNASFSGDPALAEPAGDFVALKLSDTGTGIRPELLEKVFEPFFTTKPIGAGSGLGLSMVQGFVRQSAGSVSIESVVGQGTCVTLYLPRTTQAAQAISSKADAPAAGAATVLLVDDDDDGLSMTARLLGLSGYSVVMAHTANEAIACMQRNGGRVDLLVTNFILADGLSGMELYAAIHRRRPDLPVLLIACDNDGGPDRIQAGGLSVLTKPFEHAVLARAIRTLIDAGRQSADIMSPTEASEVAE